MGQTAQGETKVDQHTSQPTPEVKVSVPARDDFCCCINPFEVPRLFGSPKGEGLQKSLAEGMPCGSIEHVGPVHGGRPGLHSHRKKAFMALSDEPQKLGSSGVSDQRCDERERCARLPTAAVNAWKVALGHALTNPATERRASNLPVD